jgi:hypothetical protein
VRAGGVTAKSQWLAQAALGRATLIRRDDDEPGPAATMNVAAARDMMRYRGSHAIKAAVVLSRHFATVR